MFESLLTIFLWLALAPASYAVGDVGNRRAIAYPTPVLQDVPSDTKISLAMTDCFYGDCPVYSLTIYADGKVLYVGKKGVKKKGEVESRISQEKLKELIAAFKEIDYFNLADSYVHRGKDCPSFWNHMPYSMTSIVLNGQKKAVSYYHGCRGPKVPVKLMWLETKINDAVSVKQWIDP